MNGKHLSASLLLVLLAATPGVSHASSGYLTEFNTTYGTAKTALDSCSVCHTSVPALNPYGTVFSANHTPGTPAAPSFKKIEPLDSDGDGFTNLEEITARTLPGSISSKP